MKFVTIPKESVLSELTIGNKVFMIDRYNECIEDVEDIDIVRLACAIKGEGEETQYEFHKKGDSKITDCEIIPISLKQANEFVTAYHRHHRAVAGCKFCIGLERNGNLIGVAICGRPVSRFLDDGKTLEVNRLCTDGTQNTCSRLYGACVRVAKAMEYKKVITYILESENGASLKASNFICEGKAGGKIWNGCRK